MRTPEQRTEERGQKKAIRERKKESKGTEEEHRKKDIG